MKNLTDISFSDIADAYVDALRKGYPVEPETLAEEFPEFAPQILSELPAIAMLEKSLRRGSAPQPPQKQPFPQVPGYRLQQELGRGAVGVVYKAEHETSGKIVAIKILPNRALGPMGERIEIEKIALSRLAHPNIVSILSYGATEQFAYIVMKLIDGVSLDQLMLPQPGILAATIKNRIRTDWEFLGQIGMQVAAGLHHAHSKGLIHRDIKPANLLIDKQENTWIADFGLAKLIDHMHSLSRTGDIIGTPRFMAPEQMRGIIDHRNDIFSLGWTLYELAKSLNPNSPLENSRTVLPICEVNPEVPAELGFIIDKACSLSPDDRYQSAEELQIVLQRFVDGRPKGDRRRSKKRLSNPEFRHLESRRNKIIAAVALCGGLALGAFLISDKTQPGRKLANLGGTSIQSPHHASHLLTEAVDGEAGFVDFVGEVFKTSLETHDPNPEKAAKNQEVVNKIDAIVAKVKKEGIQSKKLDSILEGYRESSLPIAKKVGLLVFPLQASHLSSEEKRAGTHTIQLFARSIVNSHISVDEAERILSSLFQGRVPKVEQIQTTRIPDNAFRSWLQLVNETLGNRLQSAAQESERSPDVVNEILDKFLKEY